MRTLAAFTFVTATFLVQTVAAQQPAQRFITIGSLADGSITGRVHALNGAALRGAYVEVINTETSEKLVIAAGEEGSFQVSGLVSGKYRVVVRARGYLSKSATEVDLSAGARTELDVALRRQPPETPVRTIVNF